MPEMLKWIGISRQALPGLIAEGEIPVDAEFVSNPRSGDADVYVALSSLDPPTRPVLAVLDAQKAREILAWVATYSPASFPISQCVRTITSDDIDSNFDPAQTRSSLAHLSYWPCVIVGEILGQGDHIGSIDSVALSRANACFSFSQARADEFHDPVSKTAHLCEKRLRTLDSDRMFVKRSIGIEDLAPIWAWSRSRSSTRSIQTELTQVVENATSGNGVTAHPFDNPLLRSVGFNSNALSTGTVEARVREFQTLSISVEKSSPSEVGAKAMLLSAAAICVGNGTSHISLLEEIGKRIPAVYAWFGFYAGVCGPKSWDAVWNRAINVVARGLRNRFEITEAPTSDLSWVEYEFVRNVPRPSEFLKHFPKLYPRSLSIEVVPGANCQLRLAEEAASVRQAVANTSQSNEVRANTIAESATENRMRAALHELDRSMSRSQTLVREIIALGEPRIAVQSAMFDDANQKTKKKTVPRRYTRRDES